MGAAQVDVAAGDRVKPADRRGFAVRTARVVQTRRDRLGHRPALAGRGSPRRHARRPPRNEVPPGRDFGPEQCASAFAARKAEAGETEGDECEGARFGNPGRRFRRELKAGRESVSVPAP